MYRHGMLQRAMIIGGGGETETGRDSLHGSTEAAV
jgi:hypothetical protein